MRTRWGMAVAAALAVGLMAAPTAVWATDPVQLGSGYVLDQAGVLDPSQEASVQQRMSDLYSSTGVDLYVVYVDAFTNPADRQQWADQVAQSNGLGVTQYILAVAVDGRQYYISSDGAGPMSDQQLADVEAAIKPALTSGDYAGAAMTAADGFQSALGGSGGSGGGFPVAIVVVIAVVVIAAVIIWLIIRRRRKAPGAVRSGDGPGSPLDQLDTAELARRASSALVDTDDAVKTSEQELGFASAQFGDAAAADFAQALAAAKESLNHAFTLKQQLDDSVPDTEEQTRAWNVQILQLCEQANAGLDEKAAAFDELRQLEKNAPQALAQVQQQRVTVSAALDAADARLAELSTRYAPEALSTVADNPAQARERIAFADAQLAQAQTAITAGDGGAAAVSIRAAEESVAQAGLLEQAVDKLGADLEEGERSATALIAELEGDMAAAAALPDPDGRVAATIASTRAQVDAAKAGLASTAKRPLAILRALEAANAQIDGVVQGVRDAAAQAQRTQQMLGQTIMQAQAQVSAAEDYITARRGAVGAEARTRLAEAGASLVQAQQLQASDPTQALQQAQRANQLAGQAIQYAQTDVGSFQNPGAGGMLGGGSNGGGMLGAVLGGIVINSMLGGGGRSSGGSLGGMLGGGSRSGGGGRLSPGSFGGGGTRGRRGGGRF
ncbi:TPM domain-containing protein [Microbacterium rhizomatis]|uniref:TPM domain-containing protein n=1 Tax=Microbacterium rhizomatis TaxID=1631477 RepID=A0A5J5J7P8_9MICO|nr:TPM domain-containing protein [Microbacterium rhizomatis]KAA9111154.1 TPM domain-containing protein [Microbacterium rhizomatis]